jgi:hypothetical protein
MTWDPVTLGRTWAPPACLGWSAPGFSSLVALSGRLRSGEGTPALLRRLGAIGQFTGIRYWSTTTKRWKTLVLHANAVTGPTGEHGRPDFAPEELSTGSVLYFRQQDNMSGPATIRLHIRSAGPDQLLFDTENVTTMRYMLWPLFKPGELQTTYFLQREAGQVWRFYSLARTGLHASTLTGGHEASSINRSVAFFRYLAGIPTDQEPPGSP